MARRMVGSVMVSTFKLEQKIRVRFHARHDQDSSSPPSPPSTLEINGNEKDTDSERRRNEQDQPLELNHSGFQTKRKLGCRTAGTKSKQKLDGAGYRWNEKGKGNEKKTMM